VDASTWTHGHCISHETSFSIFGSFLVQIWPSALIQIAGAAIVCYVCIYGCMDVCMYVLMKSCRPAEMPWPSNVFPVWSGPKLMSNHDFDGDRDAQMFIPPNK